VDPAAKRALWQRYPSRTENYVDVIDLAAGTMKTLFPTSGPPVSSSSTADTAQKFRR
jgi:hypothetical protein